MRWTRWLVVALLSCQATPLLAERELLAAVSDRLTATAQIQRRFEQEKSLPFLNRPLLSSGDFSISRDNGLRWRVTKPVVSEMTVDASGVHLDGNRIGDSSTGELIAGLMQAFMTGELADVQRTFSITGELQQGSWRLVLSPRALSMKSALERIEVEGASFLQQLVIVETGGAVTTIRLFEFPLDENNTPDHNDSAANATSS